MSVRSLLTAGTALALAGLVGAPALGADYPVLRGTQIETAPYEPPPSGATNWAGFYFGGTAGYATSRFDPFQQSQFLSQQAFDQLAVRDSGVNLLRFGKHGHNKVTYGGFAGFNWQFDDVVVGIEGEYVKSDFFSDQRAGRGMTFVNLFPTITQSAPNIEPINTQTAIAVAGHTTTTMDDFGMVKARAGYAFGNIMPYFNLGAAMGRISTNGRIGQRHDTAENTALYNTVSDGTTVTRTTFLRNAAFARGDASGSSEASVISSGYVPGFVLGAGIEALLGDNILLRAEYNRIYFSEFKGVSAVVDTARFGAGLKF